MPSLFRVIVQDATHYFLVIFTSHVVFELTLIFAKVRILACHSIFSFSLVETFIAINPATSCHVSDTRTHLCRLFTRPPPPPPRGIVESLCMSKHTFPSKVVGSKPLVRLFPTMVTRLMLSLKKATTQEDAWNFGEPTMRFAEPRRVVTTRDEIPLDTFVSGSVGDRNRA